MNRNILIFLALAAAAVVLLFVLSSGDGGGLDTPSGRSETGPTPPDPIDLLPPPLSDRPEPAVSNGRATRTPRDSGNGGASEKPLADLDSIRALAEAKRYEDALSELDRILAVEPENADALALRGRVYHDLGWYRHAEEDLSESARYEEGDADRLALHGENMVKLRRLGAAEDLLRRSLALDPDRARPHALLAIILKKNRDEVAAEKEIREAVRIDPEEPLTKILAAGLKDR